MNVLVVTGTRRTLSVHGRDRLFVSLAAESFDLLLVGDASGVDRLTRAYCVEYGLIFEMYIAEWRLLGRSAGPQRNQQMIDRAVVLRAEGSTVRGLAFPGRSSVGTWDCLRRMVDAGIPTRVELAWEAVS